ncbi:MAG: EAL domain-containing protein [Lachnospiraceae bacterium]|nr:EAL domain-containing protein [Lachnospiraceae bacterium]
MENHDFMEEMYLAAVRQLRTIVFEIDYKTGHTYCSPLFMENFGIDSITNEDFTANESTAGIVYPEDIELYRTLFVSRRGEQTVTCRFINNKGVVNWYKVTLQYICGEDGNVDRIIGTMKDVSDEIRSNAELRYHRDYDYLTGTPNFQRFNEQVTHHLQWDNGHNHAMIVFDIEKFKVINDLFGMRVGDLVLIHLADVLKELVLPPNAYCRMHSDVFCICITYETKGDIIRFIERVKKRIESNKFEFEIKTSYGVYLPEDESGLEVNLMCDRAALAKKKIKDNAMQFCAFYDEEYRTEILKNNRIEAEMEQALKDRQFVMYLQPKFDLESGEIVGAEVLARWNHPTRGMVQPNDFIPLFERNGFIMRLDEYMWEEACKAIQSWRTEGRKEFPVSVNVSRYHIFNRKIESILENLLQKYELTPGALSLEITETMFFDNSDELYGLLKRLQEMGFRLEVDDFGSGYSSLNMLRNVPVDVIKIDKGFLDDTLNSEKGKVVIRHTIAMAKELQLQIIAEGVETTEHVNFLKGSNCDVAQGFYFARPMPLEEFNQLKF